MKNKNHKYTKIWCLTIAILSILFIMSSCSDDSYNEDLPTSYSGTYGNNLTWNLDTQTGILTVDGKGEMEWVAAENIPWMQYREYIKKVVLANTITSIGPNAFKDCEHLEEINIPKSITEIGTDAFRGCTNLKEIPLTDYVTSIFPGAFSNCDSLKSIYIPSSITVIRNWFAGCDSIEEFVIPDTVTEIDAYAFENLSSLKKVTIPSSVDTIDRGAFNNCPLLSDIIIDPSNPTYVAKNACIIERSDDSDGYGTLIIGTSTSIIPEGVDYVGEYAFYECKQLEKLHIPASVRDIDVTAFKYCWALAEITVAEDNPHYQAQENCLLTKDGSTLLLGCKNSVIPSGVTAIGQSAFEGCTYLTKITIPEGVISISNSFYGCSDLVEIHIPESVTQIDRNAFEMCNRTKLKIYCSAPYNDAFEEAFRDCEVIWQ